ISSTSAVFFCGGGKACCVPAVVGGWFSLPDPTPI
nr:hypothetical protein [Tanacetum cinerariifolium]